MVKAKRAKQDQVFETHVHRHSELIKGWNMGKGSRLLTFDTQGFVLEQKKLPESKVVPTLIRAQFDVNNPEQTKPSKPDTKKSKLGSQLVTPRSNKSNFIPVKSPQGFSARFEGLMKKLPSRKTPSERLLWDMLNKESAFIDNPIMNAMIWKMKQMLISNLISLKFP